MKKIVVFVLLFISSYAYAQPYNPATDPEEFVKIRNGNTDETVEVSLMGELVVTQRIRQAGTPFSGANLDRNFWTATVANNGTANVTLNEVTLTTGTNTTGSIALQSVRKGRYVAGTQNSFRGQIQLGHTGTAGNITRWGAFDGANGCFFQLDGTKFCVGVMKEGVVTSVNSGAFNGHISSFAMNTNCNTYEIYWTNKSVLFFINGTLVHKISATTQTWAATTTLPVRIQSTKTSGTDNLSIKVRIASIVKYGMIQTEPIYKNINTISTTILKRGAGNLHHIVIGKHASGTITLYDGVTTTGVSPTISSMIDTGTQPTPETIVLDCPFYNGLTIKTTAANDLTVVYE